MSRGSVALRRAAPVLGATLFAVASLGGGLWLAGRLGRDGAEASDQVIDAGPRDDPGPVHVHALGVDPGDGELYMATHTGLFRVEGPDRATRIADRFQDTMGFTVVGPDHFLASGHPDLREDLPPRLGLLESTDAGVTWDQVSLTGDADLHALAVAGGRLYAADSTSGNVLVSDDRGRTWRIQGTAALAVLVVDPADPERLFAAGYDGAQVASIDAGRSWQDVEGPALVAAVWTDGGLVGLAPDGTVHTSPAPGEPWQRAGSLPAPGAALTAAGDALYAATEGAQLLVSGDRGATWSPFAPT